jgi:hypothetical protein
MYCQTDELIGGYMDLLFSNYIKKHFPNNKERTYAYSLVYGRFVNRFILVPDASTGHRHINPNKIGEAETIVREIKARIQSGQNLCNNRKVKGRKPMGARITKEHLMSDYLILKEKLGRRPTCKEYIKNAHHYFNTIDKLFGRPGFRNLVEAAGDVFRDYRTVPKFISPILRKIEIPIKPKGHTVIDIPSPGIVNTVVNLSYRKEKFRIRRWLVENSPNSGTPVRALTFPGSEWAFERDLLICKNVESVIGLEGNKDIYEYSRLNMPYSNKVQLLNLKDSNYVVEGNKPTDGKRFNFVWLDYMGPFLQSKLDVITNLFKYGFIDNNAVFAVTFINGMRDYIPLYKEYGGKEDEDGTWNTARIITIPKILNAHAGRYGYKLTTLKAEHYCEKQGNCSASPMVFFAFKSEYADSDKTQNLSEADKYFEGLRALGYKVTQSSDGNYNIAVN